MDAAVTGSARRLRLRRSSRWLLVLEIVEGNLQRRHFRLQQTQGKPRSGRPLTVALPSLGNLESRYRTRHLMGQWPASGPKTEHYQCQSGKCQCAGHPRQRLTSGRSGGRLP
jgi:hypothetical protein